MHYNVLFRFHIKYNAGYIGSTRTGLKNFGAEPQRQVILVALRIKHADRHDCPLRGKCINLVQIMYNIKK